MQAKQIATISLGQRSDRAALRDCHNEAIHRLAALPSPPSPSVYQTRQELVFVLHSHVAFIRQVVDTLEPLFVQAADDAADYAGARIESFDLIRAATEDFIAPITFAANQGAESC